MWSRRKGKNRQKGREGTQGKGACGGRKKEVLEELGKRDNAQHKKGNGKERDRTPKRAEGLGDRPTEKTDEVLQIRESRKGKGRIREKD